MQELVENRTEVFEALLREMHLEEEKTEEQTNPFYGLDTERRTLTQQCMELSAQIERLEEEQLLNFDQYKAKSLALDKRIGIQRIKINIANTKLKQMNGSNNKIKPHSLTEKFIREGSADK